MSYVNKEDLLADIDEVWKRKYERSNYKVLYDLYRMCVNRINRAPTADVVEIIRCRDCQHYIDGKCYVSNRKRTFTYDVNIHHRKADDFCSYGERRT